MIHTAPFGVSDAFSFASRASSASFVAPKKIASEFLTTRPIERCATALLELLQERRIVNADRGDAPVRP